MKKSLILAAAIAALALSASAYATPPPADHALQAAPASHAVVKQEQAARASAVAAQASLAVIAPTQISKTLASPGPDDGFFVLTVFPEQRVLADPSLAHRSRSPLQT